MLRIFIGYDRAESISYHALVQSIINNSTVPVAITPVKISMIPEYTRPRDPKQSNEFSFSRFLVPYLCNYDGYALFMDCDMMFRTNPKALFDLCDFTKSVQVVKHDYAPKTQTKYLGNIQYAYPRKNWSSVMLFNCAHPHCKRLTPEYVNAAEPANLHRMWWTHDDDIGELSADWNHLVGEYEPNPKAKIVHWTQIGPWFYNDPSAVEFGDEWIKLFEETKYAAPWRADPAQEEVLGKVSGK